jgi:hypothetical protein
MRVFFIACFLLLFSASQAQELLCNVQVNSSQVQSSDKTVFENL